MKALTPSPRTARRRAAAAAAINERAVDTAASETPADAASLATHRAVANDLFAALRDYIASRPAGETGRILFFLDMAPGITINTPAAAAVEAV